MSDLCFSTTFYIATHCFLWCHHGSYWNKQLFLGPRWEPTFRLRTNFFWDWNAPNGSEFVVWTRMKPVPCWWKRSIWVQVNFALLSFQPWMAIASSGFELVTLAWRFSIAPLRCNNNFLNDFLVARNVFKMLCLWMETLKQLQWTLGSRI